MPIIDTVRNLLTRNKIPTLDTLQMSDLLHHLFTTAEKTERIQVAEAVYRHDHGHPSALDVFLPAHFPWLRRPRAVGRTRYSFTHQIGNLN